MLCRQGAGAPARVSGSQAQHPAADRRREREQSGELEPDARRLRVRAQLLVRGRRPAVERVGVRAQQLRAPRERRRDARPELLLEQRQHARRARTRAYAGSALCGSCQTGASPATAACTVARASASSGRR